MKTALISRYGAYGDHLHAAHLPRLIKEHYGVEHLSFETNYQGIQILQNNPFIDDLIYIDPLSFTSLNLEQHWNYLADQCDLFFNLYHSIEYGCIAMEDEQSYFRNDEYRRKKYGHLPMCDVLTRWAGLPESYYGNRGILYYDDVEHEKAKAFIQSCREKYGVKYVALVCPSGSSLHKKFIQAEEICHRILDEYPDTMIITTGDTYCVKQDAVHKRILSKITKWNFRTVALMVKYMDYYIGPNTGLSCVANSWDTPTIQLFTADSMLTHSSYAKNAFGVQSPIHCSPCHKGPYKYIGCPIKNEHPACIFYSTDKIMTVLKELRDVCLPRTS